MVQWLLIFYLMLAIAADISETEEGKYCEYY